MKLTQFRVQNYKNFDDTDWINVTDPTVIVGKNEVGKTSLFRGLSKLNPSDGVKYNRLKDFPRNRLTSEFKLKNWPGASAVFELEPREIEKIKEIDSEIKIKEVTFTRYYSNLLRVKTGVKHTFMKKKDIIEVLTRWKSIISELIAPDEKGPELQTIKTNILSELEQKITEIGGEKQSLRVKLSRLDDIFQVIDTKINEEWQAKLFKDITKEEQELKLYKEKTQKLNKVNTYLKKNLPLFVYFDEYGLIDTAVHIPRFIEDMNEYPNDLKIRSKKCLFEHVGLDIETLNKLDPTDSEKTLEELRLLADERHILMNSASQIMTEKFQTWWEQRDHKFRYQVDGPLFRIWVSDNIDPNEIELDQRSKGLQYFFSFYLVFIEEAEKTHKNAILLLDEPGLHIHASAQQKIVNFIETLASSNQLMYSTHSPFMINGDKLANIRIIYENKSLKKSQVSQDAWPSDQDALFPLQAGLGYSIAQTLFYAKRQLVVEGLSDFEILKAMSNKLSLEDRPSLNPNIIVVPAGGTRNVMPLASMLKGHKVKMVVLLDGDEVGKRKNQELKKRLKVNTILITDFIEENEGEIEDLFAEKTYLEAVKKAYSNISIKFSQEEKKEKCISKRVKKLFIRKDETYEKWRPLRVISEWIRTDNELIQEDSIARFEQIFETVNKKLK